MQRPWTILTNGACVVGLVLVAGRAASGESSTSAAIETAAATALPLGAALPGLDDDEFEEAAITFAAEEEIDEGLGPTFNAEGCGTCHNQGALGGSGLQIERRFGRVTDGVFFGFDTDEENQGGTLRQLFSNGTYVTPAGQTCNIPVEVQPASANVSNVGRRTTPLFGLGLVDSLPDAWFDAIAALQPSSMRGIAQRVPVVLPDPRDPSQSIGSLRVGRFGWKGLVPTLLVFSGDAYDNEMGITTQSCVNGVSVLEFSVENHPNNIAPPPGCNGGDLAPANPPGVPGVPEFTDDAVGPCDGGRTEIQDDLVEFTTFMERLAPPPVDTRDAVGIIAGGALFVKAKCATCHVPVPFVTPQHPHNGVPGNYVFFPFSDFLAHDMGSLGDGIGETGDPVSQTRLMRTAPLWGARFNPFFLHDGRAPTIKAAILAHDGQGKAARDAFAALKSSDQDLVVRFIRSL